MHRFARRIPACAVVVVVQLLGASWLQAQEAPVVTEGSRIRVSTEADMVRPNPLVTTLVRLTTDSLTVIGSGGGAELSIPNSAVTRLEVSAGKQSRALRGAGIGLLTGAAVGGLVWKLSSTSCEGELCDSGFDDVVSATFGAVALVTGAVGGAAVGLIVGAARPAERWEPVRLADGSARPQPGHGYRLGLSVAVPPVARGPGR
jgi:hypothetical protein